MAVVTKPNVVFVLCDNVAIRRLAVHGDALVVVLLGDEASTEGGRR